MARSAAYSATVNFNGSNVLVVTEATIEESVDMLDSTGFDSSGNRAFVAGLTKRQGTITAWKTALPLARGSEVTLKIQETANANANWNGNALIGNLAVTAPVDGLVKYTYSWTGTGAWTAPTV